MGRGRGGREEGRRAEGDVGLIGGDGDGKRGGMGGDWLYVSFEGIEVVDSCHRLCCAIENGALCGAHEPCCIASTYQRDLVNYVSCSR